ncbi:unnamed protein product, partial [Sphacelaria rigidula]
MGPAEERGARERALQDNVGQTEQKGLSADGAHSLRDSLARRVDTFHRALRGDPPARVEPMKEAVKAKPRRCDPVKIVWFASCITVLVALGLLVRNIQGVWESSATAVPKRDTFRLVSDYQAVDAQVEQSSGVMPSQEDMRLLLGAQQQYRYVIEHIPQRRPVSEWVDVLPAAQWALD